MGKEDSCSSVKKLRKARYWYRNIPSEDKIDDNTELICKDKYNLSLLDTYVFVTFEFLHWQIRIGTKTVSFLLFIYCHAHPSTGFTFVEEFEDFLGDRLK